MAHTLTFTSKSGFYCTVNGIAVTSPYTLHDGDVINAVYFPPLRPNEFPGLICNNETYSLTQEIALSDTNIEISAFISHVASPPAPADLTINYSESGGGWQYA